MKHMPPSKRLRTAMRQQLGVVRSVQVLATGPMPELEELRRELSAAYAALRKRLEAEEAK